MLYIYTCQTCSKDHLYITTTCLWRPHFTGPQVYTFHAIEPAIEPAYKDHLCIQTTFFIGPLKGGLYIQVSL